MLIFIADFFRMKYVLLFATLLGFMKPASAQTKYEQFCGNVFCVDLPNYFYITGYSENNTDKETYEISHKGVKFIQINSLLESHYSMDTSIHTIKDWYVDIIQKRTDVSYHVQKDNWFVISGIDQQTGNVYYWKKIWQGEFVSDLYIEYPPNKKKEIEPYIGTIAKSFIIHWVEDEK